MGDEFSLASEELALLVGPVADLRGTGDYYTSYAPSAHTSTDNYGDGGFNPSLTDADSVAHFFGSRESVTLVLWLVVAIHTPLALPMCKTSNSAG